MMNPVQFRQFIDDAQSFALEYPDQPAVANTYGYFTQHPVARLNQRRLQKILEYAPAEFELGRVPRVLDIACGAGLVASALAKNGAQVFGVDLNADEIAVAQRFAGRHQFGAQFKAGDVISDTRWWDQATQNLGGPPDAVVLAYALHHLPEVETFCQTLGRLCPPGTRLIVNEENPRSPLFRLKHIVRGFLQRDTESEWHRSIKAWLDILARSGWVLDSQRICGLDPARPVEWMGPWLCWSVVFRCTRS